MGLGGLAAAAAKDFWNAKQPSDWTPDEIQMLLNKSPWAKDATISYYGGQNGPLANPLPGSHRSSSRNGGSPSATSPADWKAIIRWESALPVRLAMNKIESEDVQKFYILNMVGDVPSVGANADGFTALKQVTKLEHKGDEILLSKVAPAPQNPLSPAGMLFYFSRDLALRLKDNQAIFSTKLGPIDLKCKFALKDMVYQGNLEL